MLWKTTAGEANEHHEFDWRQIRSPALEWNKPMPQCRLGQTVSKGRKGSVGHGGGQGEHKLAVCTCMKEGQLCSQRLFQEYCVQDWSSQYTENTEVLGRVPYRNTKSAKGLEHMVRSWEMRLFRLNKIVKLLNWSNKENGLL